MAASANDTRHKRKIQTEDNGQKEKKERKGPRFVFKTREQTHTTNGKWILYGNKPLNSNNHDSLALDREKIEYFTDRIVTDLSNAPAGLYTWIMRGTKDNNTIYASQTRSKQELGTLHLNLMILTKNRDDRPLFAAGELKIDPQGAIQFNLQSGLFNTSVLKLYNTKQKKIKFVTNTVVPAVINAINRIGVMQVQYLQCEQGKSCTEEEETGGKHILSEHSILSSEENVAIYDRFFNRVNSGVLPNAKKGGSKRSDQKRGGTKRSDQNRSVTKRYKTRKYRR